MTALQLSPSSSLLKTSLLANAVFSALSGGFFIVRSSVITATLGWFSPWLIIGLGLGLFGFSLVVLWAATHLNINRVKMIILMDLAWVIGSAIFLMTPWIEAGAFWIIILAIVVAALAYLQYQGLQQSGINSFHVSTTIKAPVSEVWKVLADIGTIAQWHPGVKASHRLSNHHALGASRHCDLGKNHFLDEEVIIWEKEKRLSMRITKTNLPMTADIHFFLVPNLQGTQVTVKPIYKVNYGIFGFMLDVVYIRKSYQKGMQVLLAGLKRYTEAQVS
jgi:uncharacterized protein YndB with AHSA1/START domain